MTASEWQPASGSHMISPATRLGAVHLDLGMLVNYLRELTTVECREPLLEPCSQAMNHQCS
jgi:hypothetical protein